MFFKIFIRLLPVCLYCPSEARISSITSIFKLQRNFTCISQCFLQHDTKVLRTSGVSIIFQKGGGSTIWSVRANDGDTRYKTSEQN